jgi:hypothetical protein
VTKKQYLAATASQKSWQLVREAVIKTGITAASGLGGSRWFTLEPAAMRSKSDDIAKDPR